MKFTNGVVLLVLALFTGSASMSVFALPILAQNTYVSIEKSPTPLGTTAIADQYAVNTFVPVTNSISYGGGYINLSDADLDPRVYTMNPTSPSDWWTGSGLIYTTNSNTLSITFSNLMVTAFTFKIGANTNANGWIKAYYETDGGLESSLLTPNFAISPTNSYTYGVYANNSGSRCTVITKIVVDPAFTWGLGEFGATLGGGACTEVPEPNSTGMLLLGLIGLGLISFVQRRKTQQAKI